MRTWRCVNCTYTPLSAGTHHCPRCSWTVFEPIEDGQRKGAVSDVDQRSRDHAAADMAHRDDLARDVAREYVKMRHRFEEDPDPIWTTLDNLAREYGEMP